MKKNILSVLAVSLLATGCSTLTEDNNHSTMEQSKEQPLFIDENGVITDEIAIISMSEDSYLQDMEEILTEDGFTMRISEATPEDKTSVKDDNVVYFEFNSSVITTKMKKVIEKQLVFLKKYPKIKVILEGHTDEKGSNAYNVVLGEKRAESVKKMLTNSGISSDQIEVISYGELKPLVNDVNSTDYYKNRRSVFIYE